MCPGRGQSGRHSPGLSAGRVPVYCGVVHISTAIDASVAGMTQARQVPTIRTGLAWERSWHRGCFVQRMRRTKPGQQGFTLIELLTVVAIVAVLAAIAIPQYSRHKGKALEARIRQDLRGAALAQEAYWDAEGSYYGGPSCDAMPGLRLSVGTVCTVQRANDFSFQVETSHPGTPQRCTWASDTSPSLHCS